MLDLTWAAKFCADTTPEVGALCSGRNPLRISIFFRIAKIEIISRLWRIIPCVKVCESQHIEKGQNILIGKAS